MNGHEARLLSRRRFLMSVGTIGAAAWLAPRNLLGEDAARWPLDQGTEGPVQQLRRAAAASPVRVQKVRGAVSVLTGSGGNVTARAASGGVILVDSGIVGAKVTAAVTSISRAPITHVINTHWHFDHTDANAWLHARGAAVVAHENTRRRLARETRVEDWGFSFPASPAGALPSTMIAAARTLQLNGADVAVTPYAPAHTDSDLSVHFGDDDVLSVGDTWWNSLYPFIDYSTGGSIDGTIRAAEVNLTRASARTVIVPGHGAVGSRADMVRYRDTLATIRERVAALKRQGRSVADAVAAKPTADFDATWTGGPIGADFFTRLVYKGV